MIDWILHLLENVLVSVASWVQMNPEMAAVLFLGIVIGKIL